jgi:hypothetical protein
LIVDYCQRRRARCFCRHWLEKGCD